MRPIGMGGRCMGMRSESEYGEKFCTRVLKFQRMKAGDLYFAYRIYKNFMYIIWLQY